MECRKTVLIGKFTVTSVYIRKKERFQINDLTLHLKELGKEWAKSKIRTKGGNKD